MADPTPHQHHLPAAIDALARELRADLPPERADRIAACVAEIVACALHAVQTTGAALLMGPYEHLSQRLAEMEREMHHQSSAPRRERRGTDDD